MNPTTLTTLNPTTTAAKSPSTQESTMDAVVLERQHEIQVRPVPGLRPVGPGEVRIGVHTVGICGSDVHYFTHGRIGPYVVENPMVLGHEASGTVLEVGEGVDHLAVGDRVCMEPGIPNPRSRAARLGMYNVDPDVQFWATPPVDGCLRPEIIHPADFTYKLPEQLSLEEGALIEPFAVAVHAVTKAGLAPGDVVVVVGAGTIGVLTAIAAAASGASRVYISDVDGRVRLDLGELLRRHVRDVHPRRPARGGRDGGEGRGNGRGIGDRGLAISFTGYFFVSQCQ